MKKPEIASRDSSAWGTNDAEDLREETWSKEGLDLGGTGGDGKDLSLGEDGDIPGAVLR